MEAASALWRPLSGDRGQGAPPLRPAGLAPYTAAKSSPGASSAVPSPSLPVTTLVALLAALGTIVLALRVIRLRFRPGREGPGEGSRADDRLLRAVRAHDNFVENVPLALILLALTELQVGTLGSVWVAGGALVLGRLLHASALARTAGPHLARTAGMILTWTCFLILSAVLGWNLLPP